MNWKFPRLELYPPVVMPAFPPTWEDVERLVEDFPAVHHAVTMVDLGQWTQEQAMMVLVFWFADAFQRLYAAEIDRLMTTPMQVVLPQPDQTPKEP